jgi:hypothetical protein
MMSATDVSGVAKIGRLQRRIQRWEGADHDRVGALSDYSRFKQSVKKATGLSWSMPVSYLQQWGLPDGGRSAGQLLATPGLDWELFRSRTFGTASLQFAYTLVDYPWRQTGASIADHLGVIAEINDFPGNDENSFDQLSYTQTFPGNKLLLTIGQYPLSNFDDNQYLADQQQNFNNLLFTQNGSQTYPVAGLGAYAQVNITRTIQLAAGVQNATDIAGTNLSSDGLSGQSTAWFAYAQWMPKLHGLGEAQYGFAYFDVPAVPEQAKRSTSWSFNAVQHLNDTWAIFGRANGALGLSDADTRLLRDRRRNERSTRAEYDGPGRIRDWVCAGGGPTGEGAGHAKRNRGRGLLELAALRWVAAYARRAVHRQPRQRHRA